MCQHTLTGACRKAVSGPMLPKLTVPRIGVDAGLPAVSEVLSGAFPTAVFPIRILTETCGVDFREVPHQTTGGSA